MTDLREFLDQLEKAGELHTVTAEVDPKHGVCLQAVLDAVRR